MAHNAPCATAIHPGCKCTGCGGAQHGWQGTLDIAADESGEGPKRFADAREDEWFNKPRKLTWPQAAIGCARAAIIAWLYRDSGLREAAVRAARPFDVRQAEPERGRVLRELSAELGPEKTKVFQAWAVETHFWCELLAQAAYALTQFRDQYIRAREAVEDALVQREEPGWPRSLNRRSVIGLAVRLVWKHVLPAIGTVSGLTGAALPQLNDIFKLIWPIRVLAVAMCPDPSRHKAVSQHCLDPICAFAKAEVRREVRQRLLQKLPDDWLPLIAGLNGQSDEQADAG